ncbi:MAG: class I SAM-dependent methyltransferase [Gammaproteobacteria bacterium]|nr:class I SAM-dependent methyltransferase [Gammaproteobacteria bacterium]
MANSKANNEEFWNEQGGQAWVANIETTEKLLGPLNQRLMTQAAARPGETVLDVGCGGGRTTLELAAAVGDAGQVLGVDVSVPILAVARERAQSISNVGFELADAAGADLGSNRFDLLFSRFGVMFFDEPVTAFANLHASLKPDGRLVFMCWRAPDDNPWMTATAAAAFEILPPPEPPDPLAPGPFAFADAVRTTSILEEAGFRNVQHELVDEQMRLPDVETALTYLSEMGPVGGLLRENDDPDIAARVLDAVRGVLRAHDTNDGVRMRCGAWIVTATAT